MRYIKYFEAIIYGQTEFTGNTDLQMVDDLFTEIDDLGIRVRIWVNGHRGSKIKVSERLSSIEIEADIDDISSDIEMMRIVNSRVDKVCQYLESKGWKYNNKPVRSSELISLAFVKN